MKKEPEKSLQSGNEQLKKKLEQKTASLKRTKHDLKIEASLEKVRAVVMRMRKSEDLIAVCEAMYKELSALGFTNIRNAQIALRNDAKQSYRICVYSDYEVVVMQEAPYKSSPIVEELFNELGKSKEAFYQKEFSGKKFNDWRKWRESLSPLKDSRDATAASMCFYLYSIGSGHLGISTFNTITKEQIAILQRFKNVFELSYQRYTDVAQAEARAREAKIEAALERVRSSAMAMRSSEELSDTIHVFFKELKSLGVLPWRCGVGRIDGETHITHLTTTSITKDGDSFPIAGKLKQEGHPVLEGIFDHWKLQSEYFPVLKGNEIKAYYDVVSPQIPYPNYPVDAVQYGHFMYFKEGFVFAWTENKLSEDELGIFRKFTSVLSLTYRRYLDLKEAEAQAREGQIELGLERVRASAMAMQKSGELSELVDTVFKELTKLDFALTWCIINIIDESSLSNTVWAANPDINKAPESYHMLFEDYPFHHAMMKGWKERKTKYVYTLEGQEKKIYDDYLFSETEFKKTPEAAQAASRAMEKYVVSFSFSNFGGLQTVGDVPLSDANLDILSRFGKVFDLTYTRFNDLKQAEAQARESQIQLALERVRARTMAMQKSDELKDAAALLFQQIKSLGAPAYSCGYNIWEKNEKTFTSWMSSEDGSIINAVLNIPLTEDANFIRYVKSKQKGESFFVLELRGERMREHYAYLKTIPAFKAYFDYAVSVGFDLPEAQIHHLANFSHGNLLFITLAPCPEFHDVFKRFAAVFEQTYTRFLDLQKAEAQAREAQIQLAMERVRARTMAMQKSDELSETVFILFQQFKELGENPDQATIGIINEDEWVIEYWVTMYGNQTNRMYKFPIDEPNVTNKIYKAWKEQKSSLVIELSGKELYDFATFRESMGGAAYNKEEHKRVINVAFFSKGLINVQSNESRSVESIRLLERFAGVFEQTYTRFLDLQKAEAQARESQIQLALERVRARTMAMQKSDELPEAANLLFQQVQTLGMPAWSAGYCIWDEDKRAITLWMSSEGVLQPPFRAPLTEDPSFIHFREAHERGETFFVDEIGGEELVRHYKYMRTLPVVGEILDSIIEAGHPLPIFQIFHLAYFSQGFLLFITYEPVPDAQDIFKRFGKVFEQTYTRFLDLQKAEAQAREAQIEAALERVRSRSMGMQKSEELKEVIQLVYEQFVHLNIHIEHTGFIIDYKARDDMHIWLADQHLVPSEVTIPYFDSPPNNSIKEAKEKGQDFFKYLLTFAEKNRFYRDLFKFVPDVPEESLEYYFNCPGLAGSGVLLDNIGLYIENFSGTPYSDEENATLMRFGKVFQQTYTRFLDLQKAEAQTREAQIEAALEKVRSRSLAMHHSEELKEVVAIVFDKFRELDLQADGGVVIAIFNDENKGIDYWTANPDYVSASCFRTPYFDHPINNDIWAVRNSGNNFLSDTYSKEQKNSWWNYLLKYTDFKNLPGDNKKIILESSGIATAFSISKNSGVGVSTYFGKSFSEEQIQIVKRFAAVFEQAYTRFLDLQKAEAQAREAQIEAALERVRSRTMAMQNSHELAELVATVFTELNRLEFALTSCIIWINNPELLTAEMWVASTQLNKPPEPYYIKPFRHPYFKSVIDAFKEKNKKWVYEMKDEEKKIFQEQFFNEVGSFPTLIKKALEAPESVVYSASFYNFGALEIVGSEHLTDEKFEILHRLGKVFDMSYTRFNDLKQAEAQAREARIEAALERVRSRTLAMQKSDELAETAAVLFRQLIDLGIAPNRLYIGIINDDTGDIEAWSTDEDGGKVNSRFTLSSKRNASVKKMYDAWKHQEKSITIDMQGEELTDCITYLSGELQVPVTVGHTQQRRVQNIAYFGKGFIGIASPDPQPGETIQLIERFAAVFNLTYTRFNDLKVAEAHAMQAAEDLIRLQTEKKRAEDALTELRTTQAQLIQSEKMASLGELTAGIAHEIQNPLNFVNNFSEVNTELIAEMKEEIDKGNIEEVKAIANDISDNEQKINHHGKRADAIVKGMLQHSRSSSATKEPTDINKLADEYLRLAYHGLRAKDKTFNATLKTDYDDSIGYLNIVPQDIGRVILNLITNAFYVINEKKIQQPNGYEPTISVATKKKDHTIELTVKDNGNGIPKKVLDKIFQPFFTTKPTGEGTGLGLSLSYDIVKAHGGEIKVETKEGEGSEFIVQLPVI